MRCDVLLFGSRTGGAAAFHPDSERFRTDPKNLPDRHALGWSVKQTARNSLTTISPKSGDGGRFRFTPQRRGGCACRIAGCAGRMACEPLATQSPLRHRPGSGIVIAANFVAALAMRQLAGISMPDLLLTTNGRTETDGEDYDVTSEGRLVGHIFKPTAAPVETPWMWALVHSRPEDRFPAPHGYAATREDAMQAFASVWYG
jgi:hypothetical protein